MKCVFLCLCVSEPAVYDYLFPMQSKRLQLWWKGIYPPLHIEYFMHLNILRLLHYLLFLISCVWLSRHNEENFFYLCFFPLPGHIQRLGPETSQQHFHNICFESDEMWCVNYHRLDEPWVPPGSNCPHHRGDCKLTNSAGHQLMKCLHQKGKARRDDGIIRYLCCFYVWYSGVLLITVAPGTVSAICFITKDGN